MDRVVCKMQFQEPMKNESGSSVMVNAYAVGDDGTPENARFYKASPAGNFLLYISNPDVFPFFAEGGPMYITISKDSPFGPKGA